MDYGDFSYYDAVGEDLLGEFDQIPDPILEALPPWDPREEFVNSMTAVIWPTIVGLLVGSLGGFLVWIAYVNVMSVLSPCRSSNNPEDISMNAMNNNNNNGGGNQQQQGAQPQRPNLPGILRHKAKSS